MVSALTRIFGVHNLALAEDVVQDALCRALEVWKVSGIPENPAAWLMTTAKRRAIDIVRRERTARTFAPELGRLMESEWTLAAVIDEAFSPNVIRDEQLRMMFSCCQPVVAEEVQVALVLNLLCGFGAAEIASAFLVGCAAVEKRIARGKKVLAGAPALLDLGAADIEGRLETVRRALYLLFSEGYHGAKTQTRVELCAEALRLVALLREHPPTATPTTAALAALMCLHAARLPARIDDAGDLCALEDQDRSRWSRGLIAEGLALFEEASVGETLSRYHVEAAIAVAHASAPSVAETDWATIAGLYDELVSLAPSPVVSLNRAIAIGERDGPERGLEALRAITDRERLAAYPFYEAAIAELELRRGDTRAARTHFEAALVVARTEAERRFLERRLASNCN
jgi:RNA polymerase sigma-70 factor (ECF subfamily)